MKKTAKKKRLKKSFRVPMPKPSKVIVPATAYRRKKRVTDEE